MVYVYLSAPVSELIIILDQKVLYLPGSEHQRNAMAKNVSYTMLYGFVVLPSNLYDFSNY